MLNNSISQFSDEELVKHIQLPTCSEKEFYFEELVNRHKEKLFHLIYNYIKYYGTETDAEELLLQTFSNFWFSIKKFKFKSNVYTYLYRIALNLSANFTKSKLKLLRNTVSFEEINTENKFQEKSEFNEKEQNYDNNTINLAINSLPKNQKNALVLVYYENKSYKEVANILKKTIPSVESLLFRAKQNLKKYILNHKNNL